MKKNKTTTSFDQPVYVRENYRAINNDAAISGDELWMEFEDSFIQILSGAEPFRKYYQFNDIEQPHMA